MNAPYVSTRDALSRRHFLRGLGTALALPALEAMSPVFGAQTATGPVRRFVAMNASLGFHGPGLFPESPGRGYALTPYLEKIKAHRDDFTLFSGLSHPNQGGNNGHASELTWLTSAQRPGLAGFKNSISIDQLMARHLRGQTRVSHLALTTTHNSLSWTESGVQIPAERSPSRIFKELFIDGTGKEVAKELAELERGHSILDTVMEDAKKMARTLGPQDREKLEQYFSSVRDLENSFEQSEEWAMRPKPEVKDQPPVDISDNNDILAKQRQMYHLIALALQTDSTRVATFGLGALNSPPSEIAGVSQDWHNLSHHGKDDAKINELKLIEEAEFTVFNEFLTRLKKTPEGSGNLLDATAVLFGSNLGNASSHDWRNLPVILAGGGYRHGAYVAHDPKENTPLANLFVPLAQRMGVAIENFGSSSKTTLRGLEETS
ncbi:MAG: hypothetical protein ACJAVK_000529 [Akkermansiaceae bacterium]|jgi:hypothetical protein